MQIWAETGKSALPIHNYSQILYQFLTFTQNLKRSQFVELFNSSFYTPIIHDTIKNRNPFGFLSSSPSVYSLYFLLYLIFTWHILANILLYLRANVQLIN